MAFPYTAGRTDSHERRSGAPLQICTVADGAFLLEERGALGGLSRGIPSFVTHRPSNRSLRGATGYCRRGLRPRVAIHPAVTSKAAKASTMTACTCLMVASLELWFSVVDVSIVFLVLNLFSKGAS